VDQHRHRRRADPGQRFPQLAQAVRVLILGDLVVDGDPPLRPQWPDHDDALGVLVLQALVLF
jgi:hypothetical protein